jgi:hypothetical protein
MTDTDTSKTDFEDLPAEDAGDEPVQTMQEAEDEQDQEIWSALDKQEESGEPLAADDSAADPEPDASVVADDKTVVPDADDIWANATDEQRDAFTASQGRVDNLEHAHKSEIGRTKTLRRQLSDVTVQLDKAAKTSPPNSGDLEDKGDPDDNDDKPDSWDALKNEYPEVAGPVNDRLSKIEDAQAKRDRETDLEEADAKEAHTALVIEQQDLLTEKHEDWLEVATTPEFATWLDDQPRSIRDVAQRNNSEIVDATAAGDVISRYKASRSDQDEEDNSDGPDESPDTTDTSLAARRKRQLEASSGPRPKGPGIVTGIPEDGSDESLWKAFDVMDAQESAKA